MVNHGEQCAGTKCTYDILATLGPITKQLLVHELRRIEAIEYRDKMGRLNHTEKEEHTIWSCSALVIVTLFERSVPCLVG